MDFFLHKKQISLVYFHKANGKEFFPPWLAECCVCNCSCGAQEGGCLQSCAESCNCQCPNKKAVLDNICPSKEWCDRTFCCCMSAEPGGKCLEDCQGPECGVSISCNLCWELDFVKSFLFGTQIIVCLAI